MLLCILSIVLSPAFENCPEHPPHLTERRTIKHNAIKVNRITAVNTAPNSTSTAPALCVPAVSARCAAADAEIPLQAAIDPTDANISSEAANAPTDAESSSQAATAPISSLPCQSTAAPLQDDDEFSAHLNELENMLEEENVGAIPIALQVGSQIREPLNNKRASALVKQEQANLSSSMPSKSGGPTVLSRPQSTELSANVTSSSSPPRPIKKRLLPPTQETAGVKRRGETTTDQEAAPCEYCHQYLEGGFRAKSKSSSSQSQSPVSLAAIMIRTTNIPAAEQGSYCTAQASTEAVKWLISVDEINIQENSSKNHKKTVKSRNPKKTLPICFVARRAFAK
ncbi:hypothetical protein BC939DRAFT_476681 [Gamsiella multidivaricata]|uniref:uncharacterized protein n=1 Tax=Gamsiella multidivaricata TaxID=101098 RepID=UPI00221F0197|nr:uncharacterized protein BC939DRAFT_476681 [Gamsiella multidivaricata]KAI7824714.1 hypothetical protein BC939DRAFT_476681 [Gamsiella multidivaricata]